MCCIKGVQNSLLLLLLWACVKLACSQTLYFLFKVRRVRVIKNNNRAGFIDRQREEVWVGEEQFFIFLSCAPRSPMFSKRTKRK